MQPSFWILAGQGFIFPENFQVPVFNDKDVVEEAGGQHIKGGGKDA